MRRFFAACVAIALLAVAIPASAAWKPMTVRKGQPEILHRVVAQTIAARHAGGSVVVIFDLDSTLFDNRPRTIRILQEFGAQENVPQLSRLTPADFEGWPLEPPMKKVGLASGRIGEILPRVKSFWQERFFASPYALYDVALPGTVEYVRGLHDAGATIVYLTGRSEAMRPGTIQSLKRFGFPIETQRAHLFMKPKKYRGDSSHDVESKRKQLRTIAKLGTIVAAFDNEPMQVNMYAAELPGTKVIFVDTDHSPDSPPPGSDLPVIDGFLLEEAR